jgi:predicted nucleic acid-binding protein
MTPVYADTAYYVALFNPNDAWHSTAMAWSQTGSRPVVLTEFILVELANSFTRGNARGRFVNLAATLRESPDATIVPATHELFEQGLRLFGERPDKDWSLTDCISFAVMRQRRLTDALTADQHFEQAGFTVLLK